MSRELTLLTVTLLVELMVYNHQAEKNSSLRPFNQVQIPVTIGDRVSGFWRGRVIRVSTPYENIRRLGIVSA
jgi:hypothetical protein